MNRDIITDRDKWHRVTPALAAELVTRHAIVACTGNCAEEAVGPVRQGDRVYHLLDRWKLVELYIDLANAGITPQGEK